MTLTTREPVFKEALMELSAVWPNSLPLIELFERVATRLAIQNRQPQAEILCGRIVHFFLRELLEVSPLPRRAAQSASDRPTSFMLARYLLGKSRLLSNLNHGCVPVGELTELSRRLLPLLDGTRTRADLAQQLQPSAAKAKSHVLVSPTEIEESLQALADRALLLDKQ
jgi:hypothetical protein